MSASSNMPPPPRRGARSLFATTFGAFSTPDFRLLWSGALTSTTGTWMQVIAQAWVVYSLTDSAFYLGLDAFLATTPMILFSILGGAVADRVDRRTILIISQLLQMSFAFVLALLLYLDVVEVWHILALSFATGTVQSFGGPAYQALLPTLVPREQMTNAIAMNSMQFNLARMVGPVLAGIALSTVGPAACFAINGLSFVPVVLSLLVISGGRFVAPATRGGIVAEMREGIRFVAHDRAIGELTLLAFATTLLGIPLVTLLPVFAREIFAVGETGYGWLMTASGAGSVTGALVVATLGHLKRKGSVAIGAQLLFAICLLVFAFSASFPLSLAIIFLSGASLLTVVTMVSSLVQLTTSDALRGRVMSIFMMAFRGGMPLGNLMAGWMAERFSASLALSINGVALALLATLLFIVPNRVRSL